MGGFAPGGNSAQFGFLASNGEIGPRVLIQVLRRAPRHRFSCRDAACRVSWRSVGRASPVFTGEV